MHVSARTSTRDENLMVGNAGSDERILIQEIFEPKLLSTFETHARVYFLIVPHGDICNAQHLPRP